MKINKINLFKIIFYINNNMDKINKSIEDLKLTLKEFKGELKQNKKRPKKDYYYKDKIYNYIIEIINDDNIKAFCMILEDFKNIKLNSKKQINEIIEIPSRNPMKKI